MRYTPYVAIATAVGLLLALGMALAVLTSCALKAT